MYSLLCALIASAVTYAAIVIPLKNEWYGFLPALVVLVATYILLARRHGKAVETLIPAAMNEVKQQRTEAAVKILEGAYSSAKWVFLMRSQVDGLIGQLRYMEKDFDKALPMLEKAMGRDSVSKGMLAAHWFRKHKPEQAMKTLDNAIASNKKDVMLYGLKAWMKVRLKDRDGARAVLTQGKKNTSGNAVIAANLLRLQNGEDMKMWEFGEHWWNFHLEKPSQKTIMKLSGQASAMKGARKQMYR